MADHAVSDIVRASERVAPAAVAGHTPVTPSEEELGSEARGSWTAKPASVATSGPLPLPLATWQVREPPRDQDGVRGDRAG
ncbi:hypothetical protein IMZ11_13975 [Microtetraspora sp. AC03309]|uniref:hypothetical protein n=1 Tax=Microtetraspora sp. AC03309 TaxID=2779376 RepID=UPI001E3A5097|nr:hypothetical protein [Microtetraspora sp. AC03309]MCC5576741.1 hypothetical protein [Microtetraspora sp. AC03309]